jgi:hypothetical protein
MWQDSESGGVDRLAADLADPIVTLFCLLQSYLEGASLILSTLLQGKAHLPFIDTGITLAQPIVTLALQTLLEASNLFKRLIKLLLQTFP